MSKYLKLFVTLAFVLYFSEVYSQPPSNPTIKKLVFSLGDASNPADVSSMIIATPTGTIPAWCDVNGNNCNTVAPKLPSITGKFVWCIKAYDTTSGIFSSNCNYDTLTMLPNIITKKITIINTVSTNPKNIASSIQSISVGSVPKWCNINGNNCSFVVPNIPNIPGTYTWNVIAVDTLNNLNSVGIIKDTLVVLDPYKVVDVNKRLDGVTINADGTYTIQFNFIVNNTSGQILNTLAINDDLTKVFGNSIDYKVISVENSGYLNKNPLYDGINNTNLIGNSIILLNNKQDTITLKVLLKGLNVDGNYTNSANATVTTNLGVFNLISNDPIANPNNTINRVATKFTIPKISVIVSGGFSPNNDGIDDTWIVERPYGTKISVQVFNRWGNEIYKNSEYQNDWRGKGISNFLGQDVPQGTYFYIVEAIDSNGVITKFNGSLTIVR
jgi:gliding motility-associated-like protein